MKLTKKEYSIEQRLLGHEEIEIEKFSNGIAKIAFYDHKTSYFCIGGYFGGKREALREFAGVRKLIKSCFRTIG